MLIPIQGTNYDGEADIRQQVEVGVTPYTPRGYRWWRYFRTTGEYTMSANGVERLMSISTITKQIVSGYTASGSDFTLGITASGGPSTVSLPAASTNKGRQYVIEKIDASANAAVILPNGTDKIEAAASKSLTAQYHAVWLQSDGVSNWMILGERGRVDVTTDVVIDLATKGLVLKDTQGTPHYWRVTISNLGALVITDVGTTKP
jgi:hypothetical protein